MSSWAIVLAAGRGTRFGGEENKVYANLAGQSVLARSLIAVARSGMFDGIALAHAPGEEEAARKAAGLIDLPILHIEGGARRTDSVAKALEALPEDAQIVAIHDGARPLAQPELFARCVESALRFGSGVAASSMLDTVKRVDAREIVVETPERASLRAVKTPQCFRYPDILTYYRRAILEGWEATDDAQIAERCGADVRLVPCSGGNIKITTAEDMRAAEALLGAQGITRVGTGFDVHALKAGRRLVLCGVMVPHDRGLDGHSDADVAVHALIDALLGACALGDVGALYPDSDMLYKDADSMGLLRDTVERVREAGYKPHNADVTIIAQQPKLSPYREEMREKLALALGVDLCYINVKMTTTEHLGFIGREEGIAAQAIVSVVGNG